MTVSGSGISWAICKCARRYRQITTPAPHHSDFYRPDALLAAQQIASKHWSHAVAKCDVMQWQRARFPVTNCHTVSDPLPPMVAKYCLFEWSQMITYDHLCKSPSQEHSRCVCGTNFHVTFTALWIWTFHTWSLYCYRLHHCILNCKCSAFPCMCVLFTMHFTMPFGSFNTGFQCVAPCRGCRTWVYLKERSGGRLKPDLDKGL